MVPREGAAGLAEEPEQSLAATAYDTLLAMLIRRELAVNTVLQERRLAEILRMSRTPVREALNRLESDGFVARVPGRVLVVKEFSTRELVETLHVRAILEAEAARLTAGRIPEAELDAIAGDVRRLLGAGAQSAEEDWAVDSRLHGTIARHTGNAALARLIEGLRVKTHMFDMKRVPERFAVGHREHLAIIEALRGSDPEAAARSVRLHIENVKWSIIKTLSHI